MEHLILYIALAAALGLFMAWGIGANDVSNVMSTSIGAKVLSLRQALIVAAIFEFLGATLAGANVTDTLRTGLLDTQLLTGSPEVLIIGMLATLAAAGTWLAVASRLGLPVSTTQSVVGAIIGFTLVSIGMGAVHWGDVGTIVVTWVVSPVCGGIAAYLLFLSVRVLVLGRHNPLQRARRIVPFYIFAECFVIILITALNGFGYFHADLGTASAVLVALALAVVVSCVGAYFIHRIPDPPGNRRDREYATVERVFAVLMVVTACSLAFAHGSNDVSIAVGPLAAIVSIAKSGSVLQQSPVPIWVLVLAGTGMVLGLATFGRHVIATVGQRITHLTPSRAFAAELAAATTVLIATGSGIPLSVTQTLVGAVLGVGFARGIAAIDLRVVRSIFFSWVITLPAGAGFAAIYFFVIRFLIG